jgi:hypothetical protein
VSGPAVAGRCGPAAAATATPSRAGRRARPPTARRRAPHHGSARRTFIGQQMQARFDIASIAYQASEKLTREGRGSVPCDSANADGHCFGAFNWRQSLYSSISTPSTKDGAPAKAGRRYRKSLLHKVAREGIDPPTRGFSVARLRGDPEGPASLPFCVVLSCSVGRAPRARTVEYVGVDGVRLSKVESVNSFSVYSRIPSAAEVGNGMKYTLCY